MLPLGQGATAELRCTSRTQQKDGTNELMLLQTRIRCRILRERALPWRCTRSPSVKAPGSSQKAHHIQRVWLSGLDFSDTSCSRLPAKLSARRLGTGLSSKSFVILSTIDLCAFAQTDPRVWNSASACERRLGQSTLMIISRTKNRTQ